MRIVLNGTPADCTGSVADLVEGHVGRRDPSGVAVAVNATVVPRAQWSAWSLQDGDVVDVVTAVQGG
jgi:sulfur carrier protein